MFLQDKIIVLHKTNGVFLKKTILVTTNLVLIQRIKNKTEIFDLFLMFLYI